MEGGGGDDRQGWSEHRGKPQGGCVFSSGVHVHGHGRFHAGFWTKKQQDGRRGGEVRKEAKGGEGRRDPRRGEGQPALHLSPWKRSDLKIIGGDGGGENIQREFG